MRWLHCSYPDLLALPVDYLPVIAAIAKEEAKAQRQASARQARRRR